MIKIILLTVVLPLALVGVILWFGYAWTREAYLDWKVTGAI